MKYASTTIALGALVAITTAACDKHDGTAKAEEPATALAATSAASAPPEAASPHEDKQEVSQDNPAKDIEGRDWLDAKKTVLDGTTLGTKILFVNHGGRKLSRIAGRIVLMDDDGIPLGEVPFSTRGSLKPQQSKKLVVVSGRPKIAYGKAKLLVTSAEEAAL